MKLVIDNKACEKNGLTLEEALVLYLFNQNSDFDFIAIEQSLVNKQVASKNLFNTNQIVLSSNSRKLIQKIVLDSDSFVKENETRIKELAEKLREIYIPGKKQGTQDYFKGSSSEIVQKLKKFFIDYGDFTDEQIIEATEKYVKSFNGDYKFAQLLKYFISKKVDGEKGSRLLSYIENAEQEDSVESGLNWDLDLK